MNRHSRIIISNFLSPENKKYLFNEFTADRYTTPQHFDTVLNKYVANLINEWSESDPLPGTSARDELARLNTDFLQVCAESGVYSVNDASTAGGIRADTRTPAQTLAAWRRGPVRAAQPRDDPAAGIDRFDGAMITFCDQDSINMQNFNEYFSNYDAMNKSIMPFGISTPASDARLLSRNIFRKNEHGVENGIPMYEVRTHRRNIDRDIGETLRNYERDNILLRHDMSTLARRTNYKN